MHGYHADAIVVLGSALDPDGSLPPYARQRAERAVALLAAGIAPRAIFCGRCSLTAGEQPDVTEASAMSAYAVSLGAPPEAILLEEESKDTIGNAYFVSRRWLEPNGWTSVRVVTSDFHVTRTAWVFQRILGPGYDVAFSPVSTELDATVLAARARAEGDITTFLMEWIGELPEGDRDAVERLIWSDHPGYAPEPVITAEQIRARVEEISRVHRVTDVNAVRGHRARQERNAEL